MVKPSAGRCCWCGSWPGSGIYAHRTPIRLHRDAYTLQNPKPHPHQPGYLVRRFVEHCAIAVSAVAQRVNVVTEGRLRNVVQRTLQRSNRDSRATHGSQFYGRSAVLDRFLVGVDQAHGGRNSADGAVRNRWRPSGVLMRTEIFRAMRSFMLSSFVPAPCSPSRRGA